MRIYFLLLGGLLFWASCGSKNLQALLHSGSIENQEFFTQIPFDFKGNEIIIRAKINGVEGTFMVDTGAPNVLSKSFREKLGLKAEFKRTISDSQNNQNKEEFLNLDVVEIGDLKFRNMGAVVVDLTSAKEIGCFQLDGLIGANLMRKAYWQIDYQEKQIRITDQYQRLKLPKTLIEIPFWTSTQGTPHLQLRLKNKLIKNLKLDTGSTGYVGLDRKNTKAAERRNTHRKMIGYSSSGIYGADKDTTLAIYTDSLWIGDVPFTQTYVGSSYFRSNTLGNRFLQAYELTIDWFKKRIILVPVTDYKPKPFNSYGFTVRYGEEELIISSIVKDSPAMVEGLEVDDVVLEINGIDTQEISHSDYCEARFDKRFFPKKGKLVVKIQKPGSAQLLELDLEQFMLFEKGVNKRK